MPLVCADPPELKLGDIMTELMERLQTPVSQQRHRRSGEHAAGEDTAFGLLETNNVNYNHRQASARLKLNSNFKVTINSSRPNSSSNNEEKNILFNTV